MNRQSLTSVAPGLQRPHSTAGAALVLALAMTAAGCGQKGPLTLPKRSTSTTSTAASAPAR